MLLPVLHDFEIARKRYSTIRKNIYFGPSRKRDMSKISLFDFFMGHHIGLWLFANIEIQYASFCLDINV